MLQIEVSSGLKQILIFRKVNSLEQSALAVEIGKLINRRELSKTENASKSFDILIRYLKYIGQEDVYFDMLVDTHDDMITMADEDIIADCNHILELFTSDTINEFLHSENYTSPGNLVDEFNNDVITNKEGTREQTYTKADYRDLVILTIKLKALSLIIARYVAIHGINVNGSNGIRLYRIVKALPSISNAPAFNKLLEFIGKNIAGDESISPDDIGRILSKNITNSMFISFITLNILIYLAVADTPDTDTITRNLVNEGFRLCRNKTAITKNYIINDPGISIDDEGGSSSVTDTYLSTSKVPIGYIDAIQVCFSSIELILQQLLIPVNTKYIDIALHTKTILLDKALDPVQTAIISWLFADVFESEYMEDFDRDTIANLRIISYAILKTHGIDEIADMMLGTIYESGNFLNKQNANLQTIDELEVELTSMFSLSINKKAKSRTFGLSILDDSDDVDEDNIKESFIRPVVRRLSTTKWISYIRPKEDSAMVISNARKQVAELMTLVYRHF